jgi:hypothetical protein
MLLKTYITLLLSQHFSTNVGVHKWGRNFDRIGVWKSQEEECFDEIIKKLREIIILRHLNNSIGFSLFLNIFV